MPVSAGPTAVFRFNGAKNDVEVEIDVGIGDAVECVVAPRGARAGDGHGEICAGTALPAGGLAEAESDVRADGGEAQEVAAVQRKAGDAFLFNDGAVLRGEALGRGADLVHCKPEIDAGCAVRSRCGRGLGRRITDSDGSRGDGGGAVAPRARRASAPAGYHKYFNPNWTWRPTLAAPVSLPKAGSPTVRPAERALGSSNVGVLLRLKASTRNSKRDFSEM